MDDNHIPSPRGGRPLSPEAVSKHTGAPTQGRPLECGAHCTMQSVCEGRDQEGHVGSGARGGGRNALLITTAKSPVNGPVLPSLILDPVGLGLQSQTGLAPARGMVKAPLGFRFQL